ncbi:MAG: hypothetical protein F4X56_05875 [Gammaproteobacteria bacterium]|nr:hypothetical protein [Gammaproteobacteria bacterium]MYC25431.1 hypothetical protein [Gammaproteobacteria bacterium]
MTEMQPPETSQERKKTKPKKIPIYRNVIWMLVIVEIAILVMYLIDAGLVLWASSEDVKVTYESASGHIINLQMIAVGGAVAMFERLIPARKTNDGD